MTSSAAVPEPRSWLPDANPAAIRVCLPPAVAAEFDRDWDAMMERARKNQDVTLVHNFLAHWRVLARLEMIEPGNYFRTMEEADQAIRRAESGDGREPGSLSASEIRAMISARLNAQ